MGAKVRSTIGEKQNGVLIKRKRRDVSSCMILLITGALSIAILWICTINTTHLPTTTMMISS